MGFMRNINGWEIILIALVIILVFGAAKLPMIASNVGKSLKVFKKEVKELRNDDDDEPTDPYQATGATPTVAPANPAQPVTPGQAVVDPPAQPAAPTQPATAVHPQAPANIDPSAGQAPVQSQPAGNPPQGGGAGYTPAPGPGADDAPLR